MLLFIKNLLIMFGFILYYFIYYSKYFKNIKKEKSKLNILIYSKRNRFVSFLFPLFSQHIKMHRLVSKLIRFALLKIIADYLNNRDYA